MITYFDSPARRYESDAATVSENNKPQMSVLLTLSVSIILTALGLRPQTPTDAPPLAGFNTKSPVAYFHD
ncbi:MAG: hypothetical protein O8C65_13235, partial [Candidatus Methanoperedens sp.]|nr:hypothetical protein [Candidatus Methanoperedens sp.]